MEAVTLTAWTLFCCFSILWPCVYDYPEFRTIKRDNIGTVSNRKFFSFSFRFTTNNGIFMSSICWYTFQSIETKQMLVYWAHFRRQLVWNVVWLGMSEVRKCSDSKKNIANLVLSFEKGQIQLLCLVRMVCLDQFFCYHWLISKDELKTRRFTGNGWYPWIFWESLAEIIRP